jgi:hypothetical protein
MGRCNGKGQDVGTFTETSDRVERTTHTQVLFNNA